MARSDPQVAPTLADERKRRSRQALQIVIAVLSVLPLTVGALGFVFGAGLFLPAGVATPRLDSQFRFTSAWDVGLATIAWWIIPRIEIQSGLFRLVCAAIFCGGIGRVIAWIVTGSPGVAFLAVTAIELLIPLLIPWQASVASRAAAGAGNGRTIAVP